MRTETDLERYFSISEAGRILGYERSTIYSRIKHGRLRAVRIDGTVRVPRSELARILATATPLSETR